MKTMTCKQLGGKCDHKLSAETWDQMVQTMTKHVMEKHPDVAKQMEKMHNDDHKKWAKEMKPEWDATAAHTSRKVIVGRVLSGLAILALSLDAGGKLLFPSTMIANTPPTGLPADIGFYRLLGSILAASVALYAWPRTSFLGAILLTGYLGGAVATNLRVSMPLFTFTLVGVYLGLLVWGGLWLRDARLRALFS